MPEAFVEGLNDQSRHAMADLLNARLADTIALTLAVKQAHWNVKGSGFIGVHELLDDVADRLREAADLMAERCTILGGQAKGTVEVARERSKIEPYPTDQEEIGVHVTALQDRFMKLGASLREAAEAAAEGGDAGTEDLFVEVIRQVDKDAWFIGANAPR